MCAARRERNRIGIGKWCAVSIWVDAQSDIIAHHDIVQSDVAGCSSAGVGDNNCISNSIPGLGTGTAGRIPPVVVVAESGGIRASRGSGFGDRLAAMGMGGRCIRVLTATGDRTGPVDALEQAFRGGR